MKLLSAGKAADESSRPSCEGRGLKSFLKVDAWGIDSRPSCEGRGLKFGGGEVVEVKQKSSLMRGTWIEISWASVSTLASTRRPSCEGRGLKYAFDVVSPAK